MNRTDRLLTNEPVDRKFAGRSSHGWMVMICCIQMLAIAVVLVVTGVASTGFLFTALACSAMMAMIMRGMDRGAGMHVRYAVVCW